MLHPPNGGGQIPVTQGKLTGGTRSEDPYRSMDANELGDLLLEVFSMIDNHSDSPLGVRTLASN